MRRREFIALTGSAAAWPLSARAQYATGKVPRVGIIDETPLWEPFRQELRELGYTEGRNIAFETRRADGIPDRLDAAARELTQLPVDVLAVYGTPAAQAAQRATNKIPIVIMGVGDPVGVGLVTNFAWPGDNITGNTILSADVVSKRLQVLKDAIPSISRIALLWNPDNASNIAILQETQKAAPLFHMTLTLLEARTADDFNSVFAQMASNRPDALLTTNDPLHQSQMAHVIDFLLKNRVASMFQLRQNVADGGLMAYAASVPDLFRRGAAYVDKILRGTKPGDLPIEQPLTFELIVNLKTAKAIGIDFPQALLARADEVIE